MNAPTPRAGLADLKDCARFDTIIDVRSPAEFADDHIPGAISCPVLSNEERAEVGTLYVQQSPFEAKRRGAALIARNISRHLETCFADKPINWRPLIYCWRGGMRSGAMTTILQAVGWKAAQLAGGYKHYRSEVLRQLAEQPARFDFHVLCGPTGSGKSRLLQTLAARGEQVLDLEALACHKGSLLGNLPDQPQPGQKWFESQICAQLGRFDPARPVFAEAESRRIGQLRLPDALLAALHRGQCVHIEASLPARVAFLQRDYRYFCQDPQWLSSRLLRLREIVGQAELGHWLALVETGDWPALVTALLEKHYDPLYRHSESRHYPQQREALTLKPDVLDEAGMEAMATTLLQHRRAQSD